jgi:hypothetical protein
MRKGIVVWFTLSVLAVACAHSGHLVSEPMNETSSIPGVRSGYVLYRNDTKADRRRNDALRKIAKYCGNDGYTVTSETRSAEEIQINFRCGSGAVATATPASALPSPSRSQ